MGKQGPCRHCGVTSTPLWRNGPPEKPVLCNACGSRWRTKGSLDNYFPLHAREPFDAEDFEVSEVRTICHKPKEEKPHKKKHNYGIREIEYETPYSRIFEGDPSNRSSSGSAISYSGSCAHFGTTDASDLTGSVQSNVRDSLVPSKKRACVSRPKLPPHVEELTRDLHSILQEQQSSNLSASSEELLYDSETPMGLYEIGHGGVLLRYIDSETIEEESEASSLPIDNKSYIASEAYSESASFPVHSENKRISNSNTGIGQVVQEHVQQDTVSHEKIDALRYRSSFLTDADLNEIATFEVFMKCMTHEDRQQLMRDLPAIDTEKPTESLKSMFQSSQFMETLSDFKQLLKEGLFDRSFAGANVEDSRILRKLVLRNLTKSKWVKEYTKLQNVNYNEIIGGKEIAGEEIFFAHPRFTSVKRSRDNQNEQYQELRGAIRRPQSVPKSAEMNLPSTNTSQMNSSDGVSEVVHDADNNEGSCFTLRSMFASPADRSPPLRPLQFNDENSDQDLLLGVARNWSFPEAQLLFPPRNRTVAQSRSQAESGVAGEESLSNT